MAEKRKILVQLDCDALPSVFDRVVAVDAGAEFVFSYGGVTAATVRDLVYGGIFTRGPEDLHRTAFFVGGSDVSQGEEVLKVVRDSFLGPLRCSVMLDCAGANTTAAAAVLAAARHGELSGRRTLVLGSTGPVGQRVTRLLARQGAIVRAGSRSVQRAQAVAKRVASAVDGARVEPFRTERDDELDKALDGVEIVIAAGPPGVCVLPPEARDKVKTLRVLIDLNAVPPEGVAGVKGSDASRERDGVIGYGAIGVGGFKMKLHKAAVVRLFEGSDHVLDADEIFDLGLALQDV